LNEIDVGDGAKSSIELWRRSTPTRQRPHFETEAFPAKAAPPGLVPTGSFTVHARRVYRIVSFLRAGAAAPALGSAEK